MSKFKAGDTARVIYIRKTGMGDNHFWHTGAIVEIVDTTIKANPNTGNICSCSVLLGNGNLGYPLFEQLDPIIKASWEQIQESIGWNPTKEVMDELF